MFWKKKVNSADSHLEKLNKSALKENKSTMINNESALKENKSGMINNERALKIYKRFENRQVPRNYNWCQFPF